ncbi:hypothetical protein POVWA2_021940 [Plasmodium ovale wallikeri]|uniref:Uncharacterized protein n=1 Tax=Plasmodium ovale wallikeri TaxID=864142 RepID=A0A1A8YSB6_PLAOA|nr:hypothetical protein POVWA1_022120 [Plasmodium ovale wallikeri]SBT34848.1 hypothetical protein POVWA2_021940 [Plasmodium ovale wallikeri]
MVYPINQPVLHERQSVPQYLLLSPSFPTLPLLTCIVLIYLLYLAYVLTRAVDTQPFLPQQTRKCPNKTSSIIYTKDITKGGGWVHC